MFFCYTIFMWEYIFLLLAISLLIQIILFIPAFLYKTDKLTDLSYSLSFFVLALVAFLKSAKDLGHLVVLIMVSLWAIRLGTYLFIRIRKIDRDKRFDGIRENFFKFLKFWLGQGVVVWLVMMSAILYFSKSVQLNTWSWLAVFIWLTALSIESIADWQKYVFINNKENKGQWIQSGLWKHSRHPNYFGEILHWLAIYIFVLNSLNFTESIIAFISPLFISIVIIFVTGLPMLEKEADKRWGDDENYIRYKKNTSVLIPWFK